MSQLRRGLRAIRYAWRNTRSALLLLWYRGLYAGFRVGGRVRLGRGVDINVITGGSLTLGEDSEIEANVQITAEGEVSIGPRAFIGRGSVIASALAVQIGADALFAAYVTVRDQDHGVDQGGTSYSQQPKTSSPVMIGNN